MLYFITSVLLTFGIVISYIPQCYKIIKQKSSFGYSPWFLLIGVTGSIALILNTLIIQSPVIVSCKNTSLYTCLYNTLGIIQILCQTSMAILIFVLFLIYYPRPEINIFKSSYSIIKKEWKNAIIVSLLLLVFSFVLFLISLIFALYYGLNHSYTYKWAQFLGLLTAILSVIQYCPQIYRTCKHQHTGSLSILSMSIQVPGTFLLIYTIILRPYTDYTNWLSLFISATLQGILLMLCFFYKDNQI